jgi:hypothetical protein
MSNKDDADLRLADVLEKKSPELSKKYDFIIQELATGVQRHIAGIRELPDHGERHHKSVEEDINRLLPGTLKQQMPAEEIFILLCSVHFHGIGRLFDPGESGYAEKTYDYIHEHHDEWQLNPHEARLIKQICLGLGKTNFETLPREEVLHRARIRVRFLAGLLRLAKALDTDYTRISKYILQLRKFSPASRAQWLKVHDISGVFIDPDQWSITVDIMPETIESRRILEEFVEGRVQSELDLVHDIFRENDLYYRKVDIRLVHEIAERDARVAASLSDYYELSALEGSHTPYKFLDYFEPRDREIFFGREGDIQRFLVYIRAENLIVLYGESGVGKTSLIRAGLIPKLIDSGFIPVYTRSFKEKPSDSIKRDTAQVISCIAPKVKLDLDMGLRPFFERLTKRGYEFVIFVDQFEELFISFPESESLEFVQELIDCLNTEGTLRVTFVLSIRRDHFLKLGGYKSALLELYTNAYELSKLTREDVRQAVKEPALHFGISYEDELLIQLVDDIYREGEYNTPHIQIVCDRLVKSLDPDQDDKIITLELYERLGRASTILGEYLQAEIVKFPPGQQENVMAILKDMVTSEKTKVPSTLETIARHTRLDPADAKHLLLELANRARLVRVLDLHGEPTFELAHEFLVEEINKWFKEGDREIKAIYEMLNRQIIEWKRDKRFLLDRTRLEEVERHKGVLSLDEKSKELIFASYLRNDPASEKKWFWLDVLSKEIALDLVVRAIRDGDESVYTEGIKILAQIGTNATQLLISRLSDTDWKVRQALIEALLLCGDSGLNDLRKGLGHTDRRIRRGVVTALVRLDSH